MSGVAKVTITSPFLFLGIPEGIGGGKGGDAKRKKKRERKPEFVALWDYEKQLDDEMSFRKGDRITILEDNEVMWFLGELRRTREIGMVPRNYCVLLEATETLTVSDSSGDVSEQMKQSKGDDSKSSRQLVQSPEISEVDLEELEGSYMEDQFSNLQKENVKLKKQVSEFKRMLALNQTKMRSTFICKDSRTIRKGRYSFIPWTHRIEKNGQSESVFVPETDKTQFRFVKDCEVEVKAKIYTPTVGTVTCRYFNDLILVLQRDSKISELDVTFGQDTLVCESRFQARKGDLISVSTKSKPKHLSTRRGTNKFTISILDC